MPHDEKLAGNSPSGQDVDPDEFVASVLERHPQLLDVFLRFGFTPLKSAAMRQTVAKVTTVRQACRLRGVDVDELLAACRTALNESSDEGA
jgi:hypothetical protein